MVLHRYATVALASLAMLAAVTLARADDLKVIETWPAANAAVEGLSDGFLVRFNQPVDHISSRLFVKRGGEIVETLNPRLQSSPNVLFARAPALPSGSYTLHWVVKTVQDVRVEEGDVSFSIGKSK